MQAVPTLVFNLQRRGQPRARNRPQSSSDEHKDAGARAPACLMLCFLLSAERRSEVFEVFTVFLRELVPL